MPWNSEIRLVKTRIIAFQSSIQRVMPWNWGSELLPWVSSGSFQSSIQRVMPWNNSSFTGLLPVAIDFSPLFKESCRGTFFSSSVRFTLCFYFSPLFKESCRGTVIGAAYCCHLILISVLYSKSHAVEQRKFLPLPVSLSHFSPLFKESCRGTRVSLSRYTEKILISVLYSKSHAVELF